MPGPLDGYTVLQLGGGVAAGYCGRLLAGFGATVIQIEPPAGDPLRHARVVPGAPVPDPEAAPAFAYLGMGKRSVVASLDAVDDVTFLTALARRADVVLTVHPSAAFEAVGLSWDRLSVNNPGLVWTAVTPFGDSGPYRDHAAENITIVGMGGQMQITGEADREPLCTAGEQGWYQAGLHAFAATTFALLARSETGLGQMVDVSAVECMAGALEGWGPGSRFTRIGTVRTGKARFSFMGVYDCTDGYGGIFCSPGQVPIFAKILNRPELVADPRTQSIPAMVLANDALTVIATDFFAAHAKAEIREIGRTTNMTIAPVQSIAEVAADRQLAARGFFVGLPLADGRTVRVPGALCRMSGTPWESRPAPRLGELSRLEAERLLLETPAKALVPRPADPPRLAPAQRGLLAPEHLREHARLEDRHAGGLLAGVRVLDLTAYWAGPYATKWLADFGAEVIKVEPANRLDLIRAGTSIDYTFERPWDVSAYFNNYARGKQSLAIDPAQPSGRQVILDLVPHCDIVIENFKAGRMAAIGLSYETLRALRPDLVMVSISGYGQDGPDADLAGVGTNMEQLSGIVSLNVYSDAPQPYNSGIAYGDPIAGTAGAAAVALALMHRNATGEGQYVDISGLEGLVSLIGEQFAALSLGLTPAAKGNRHPDMVPHGCYPCEGDDRWVTVAVRTDAQWQRLCAVIGRPDLAEAYPTLEDRRAAEYEIDAGIIGWMVLQRDVDAARSLQDAGIAAAPVLAPVDQPEDLQLRLRGYFETVRDPDMGPWPHDGIAWRLSRTPGALRGPAPRLGEHTRRILFDLLHYSPERIAELFAAGVAGDGPGR